MKILIPEWVHHDEKPIFSIDIHPHGNKFAIGGLGADAGRVTIWNLSPVLNNDSDKESSVPKLLCQMDNHLSCVNCVRWSYNGEYLATGSDDKLVMIWRKTATKSGAFGTGGMKQNVENWRCMHTLRGHSGDVLDLAWSPQDRWLATSSVDNSIIVWDALNFPTMIAILKGHTGLVKGVTWDPVGKFLASQSDDKTVRIWKTTDWTCQSSITDPFEECGGTTHVLRLAWSPDGQYLVSAHAMNNGVPTAQIIEREGWKCDKDFVGHRKAITCVRFNSAILNREIAGVSKPQKYCCLAMGSRDKSLSIWSTNMNRPTIVLDDVFQDSVLDIAWSSNGYLLMACSSDGTVACIQFEKNELGTPLTIEEKNELYQRIYGKDINLDFNQAKDIILENSEMLSTSSKESLLVPSFSSNQKRPEPTPIATSKTPFAASTLQQQTTQSPQKRINTQLETRTVDGKRRITPRFIPVTDEPLDTASEKSAVLISSQEQTTLVKSDSITSSSSVNPISINDSASEKESAFVTADQIRLDARIKKIIPPTKPINLDAKYNMEESNGEKKATNAPIPLHMHRPDAGNPKPFTGSLFKVVGNLRITVVNETNQTLIGPLTRVTCTMAEKKIWELHIDSPIVIFNCCSRFIMTCSNDGTLRFIETQSGMLLLPVITLATPVVLCSISANLANAAILTKNCELRIWNIEKKCKVQSMDCSDVISKGAANALFVNDHGDPFITLCDGASYSFSKDLDCWLKLSSADLMSKIFLSRHIGSNFTRNMKQCPLTTIQSFGKGFNVKTNALDMIPDQWPHTMELLFLENQIKLCETLTSSDEIRFWYAALGTKLATHGTEQRIRKVLDGLLNNHMCGKGDKNSKIYLEILLDKMKKESKWQRLFMEYNEQIC
ncbi:protein HIRA homolog [Culicoides brevitarsis]|uniref:protein HIRA homolog n=1 Tax=Culicoides brevitarsis TaxID=469753 RepID=UPI00307CA519